MAMGLPLRVREALRERAGGFALRADAKTRVFRGHVARAVTAVVLLGAFPVQAQVSESGQQSAEAERLLQQREQVLRQQLQTAPDVRLPSQPLTLRRQRLPSGEAPCFVLDRVELVLDGEAPLPLEPLYRALAGPHNDDSPLGRCLGAEGVGALIARAQDALIEAGYVTSRVAAVPQDLKSGVLLLQVLPGRVGTIRLAQPDDRATLVNAMPMKAGDLLNLRDVEQALENLKRVPTAEADIQIEPGSQPGHSDLVVRWSQRLPLRMFLTADDSGANSSGKYQGSATASYDSPFTLNDLFYVTVSRDLGGGGVGPRGTRGLNVHYSLPMGYWLLSVNGGHNRYHQSIAGATQEYLYSGKSHRQDLELRQLIKRSATDKTSWSIKAFARQSENHIDDTEIQVQRRRVGGYELGVQHQAQWGDARIDLGVNFKRGTGAFGSAEAPEEAFGEGTHRFGLWSAHSHWRQPFEWAGQRWQYSGQWRGQRSRTPLTPQDRFAVGGRFTVRGFDGQTSLAAENGWLVRNEVSTAVAGTHHHLYMALDHGRVSGPTASQLLGRHLTGFALGARGMLGGLNYDVFVGTPLHKPPGFRTANTTCGIALSADF